MQTIFHLHLPKCPSPGSLYLTLERGAHEPYPAESLAPFHHDPAQRILALEIQALCCLIVRVEALLELLRDREGTEIGWDEWKHHLVLTSTNVEHPRTRVVQVSGCRLFCIYSTDSNRDFQMEVYDFSREGRMKHLKEQTNGMLGAVTKYLTSDGVAAKIPRRALVNRSGDLSIVLFYVCIAYPLLLWNATERVVRSGSSQSVMTLEPLWLPTDERAIATSLEAPLAAPERLVPNYCSRWIE